MGCTTNTQHLQNCLFDSDWNLSRRSIPGRGVGGFFHARWQGRWIHLQDETAPTESRFFLLSAADNQLIIGVFYAPHQNHLLQTRLSFWTALHLAIGRVTARHPNTPVILAGDANLPELQFDDNGVCAPAHTITQYFYDNFLTWLECANTARGIPLSTQKDGATLDLILYTPGLVLREHWVEPTRLHGCDHHLTGATFSWNHKNPSEGLAWIPNRACTQD